MKTSAWFISQSTERIFILRSTSELSGEFHFGLCWSNMILTLHEAEIEIRLGYLLKKISYYKIWYITQNVDVSKICEFHLKHFSIRCTFN